MKKFQSAAVLIGILLIGLAVCSVSAYATTSPSRVVLIPQAVSGDDVDIGIEYFGKGLSYHEVDYDKDFLSHQVSMNYLGDSDRNAVLFQVCSL